jgi:glycosidase
LDAHVGTVKEYQQLSDALHRKGMYLVQDIVLNHTGDFFRYQTGTHKPRRRALSSFPNRSP